MNRIIKFRAWWKDTGKPVFDFMDEYWVGACNDEQMLVEQFTGLTDRNGVEIFEGDIVKTINNRHLVVAWDFDRWILCEHYPIMESALESIYNIDKCEKIGNKFENPELMEIK